MAETETETRPVKKLRQELIDIDSVTPYHKNARLGKVDVIRESLRKNGQFRSIVIWEETGEILAGNHTWKAAKQEKWKKISAEFVSCDPETAERINLADNRTAELGGYDTATLLEQLGSLPDLEGTGWSTEDYQKLLLGDEEEGGAGIDPDDVPDDDYQQQLGVIVLCETPEQQEQVFERLQHLAATDKKFENVEIKVVAV